jgi:CheY-like chemotaxis protein
VDDAILIADADRERAQRLGAALAERGFAVSYAEQGAAALEAALSEVPDVVVATDRLPLIDARRLAEILRANPRTRSVRLVYLGGATGPGAASFDETAAEDLSAADLGARIEALLGKRVHLDVVERASADERAIAGSLAQVPLSDLLQLFLQNRRTGRLQIRRGDGENPSDRGEIFLQDGAVVQAKAGVRAADEKALFRLLSWPEGEFAFTPTAESVPVRIQTPTRSLLLEGARQLDEWSRLAGGLPSLGAHLTLAMPRSQIPRVVHPVAQEVLLLLEAYDEVQAIVDHCTHADYQVLRTLQTLIERGIVRLRRDRERRTSGTGGALFDATQARRLREWQDAGRPRGGQAPPVKLLLASAQPAATAELLRALEALPGVERIGAGLGESVATDTLAPLVRLSVADGLAIEVLHVPAGRLFAPLWPALAHGALGIVQLLASPVAQAEATLGPLSEAFQRLPGSRVFRVLLLRKGERVAPEEIQEKFAELTRSSLFLLHLDGERDPASLLRTMLARVMP